MPRNTKGNTEALSGGHTKQPATHPNTSMAGKERRHAHEPLPHGHNLDQTTASKQEAYEAAEHAEMLRRQAFNTPEDSPAKKRREEAAAHAQQVAENLGHHAQRVEHELHGMRPGGNPVSKARSRPQRRAVRGSSAHGSSCSAVGPDDVCPCPAG
jgi:hypothetical protein